MFDKQPSLVITELSNELKSKIKMPEWAVFVKTGMHKDRPPVQDDWWYLRAASIMRQIELKGPIGVSKLRNKYGGRKKNAGMRPEHFYRGSGKIIRTIMQQLESNKLVEQTSKGVHKGRVLTSTGKSLLFTTAKKVEGPSKIKVAKPEVEKVEEKKPKKTLVKEEKPAKKTDKVEAPKELTPAKEEAEKPKAAEKEPKEKKVAKALKTEEVGSPEPKTKGKK